MAFDGGIHQRRVSCTRWRILVRAKPQKVLAEIRVVHLGGNVQWRNTFPTRLVHKAPQHRVHRLPPRLLVIHALVLAAVVIDIAMSAVSMASSGPRPRRRSGMIPSSPLITVSVPIIIVIIIAIAILITILITVILVHILIIVLASASAAGMTMTMAPFAFAAIIVIIIVVIAAVVVVIVLVALTVAEVLDGSIQKQPREVRVLCCSRVMQRKIPIVVCRGQHLDPRLLQ